MIEGYNDVSSPGGGAKSPLCRDRGEETSIQSSGDSNVDTSRSVLKPKLRTPALRSEQFVRPRLLEHLGGEALRCNATLISGPVGYGKSTLLAQWRQAEGAKLPFAWVSLDERDNDPVRLWRHIIEALRAVALGEDIGADALVGLGVVGADLSETVLPMLINDLTELPHRVVLVLDDYHFVTERDCHETVAFFVGHLPEIIHLVISTRSDPSLAMGRLRATGELNEIRTEELAFSENEAASLLVERMGLDISHADLALLFERTEGWPAGIYLAGLSMRDKDTHAFIESLRGSSRHIGDLLTEEVLATLSEGLRDFLLRTSVLEKMCGPLCDEVAGTEGSGKLLRELEHSNLFVVPLDDSGEWYRYHHLFGDFLLYELKNTRLKLVPVLHGLASAWFEREGLVEEAIGHAIAAGEYAQAGHLIARYWFGYAVTGQTATLRGWLDALPEGLVSSDAALALVEAWISGLQGWREETERFLALAEGSSNKGPLPDGTASVESGVALLRSVFGYDGVLAAVEAARLVAELEPRQRSPRTALMRFAMGFSLYCSGDTAGAVSPLEEALRLTSVGQPVLRILILAALSFVGADEGHLEDAEAFAREADALVDRFGLRHVPQATAASIALGKVLAKRGNLAVAQSKLESSLSVRRKLPGLNPWGTLVGLLALASVRSARGDRAGAREILAEARATLEPLADDTGIFTELLERQEHKNRARKPRKGQLDGELTERELDILGLLHGELSTSQIAQSLYIAPNTARTHIKSIYRKLGVSSREEAVEEAHARGVT